MSGGTPIKWSTALPRLQTHVSSTTLGEFKRCARKYYYSVILRRVGAEANVHLVFGGLVHEGLAWYELERARGKQHDEAVKATIYRMARRTWNARLARPWHSVSTSKNRDGLLRTLVWYLDHYSKVEGIKTTVMAAGGPAVEIKCEMDSGFVSPITGDRVYFVATLDKIVRFNDNKYVLDTKTTGRGVGAYHTAQFTPNNQFTMYTLVAQTVLDEPIAGIILDGVEVGVGYSGFARSIVKRMDDELQEWLKGAHVTLEAMGQCAEVDFWPMNDTACYGCEYREICSLPPSLREDTLKRLFVVKQEELQID